MPEIVRMESPLARFRLDATAAAALGASGVAAFERPWLGHLNLRGRLTEAGFSGAVAGVLGTALPSAPNTVAVAGETVAYWLGPDEWLVVVPGAQEAEIAAALREALRGIFAAVTEVGSGQTVIVLRGRGARDLLAKECPFDLHAPSFVPGACAQTRLAKAAVLLRPLDDGAMELVVRRSFADYLWSWLVDAAAA